MRPVLAPDAFVRAYVSERGWGYVLVRRARAPRLWLSRVEHAVVELCDGERSPGQLAQAAGARLGRSIGARQVESVLARLGESGAIMDLDRGPEELPEPPSVRGLVSLKLDEARANAMRVSLQPGVGFDCDGRGGCCRLYDLVSVRPKDVAALEEAYGEGHLPGGLTVHSAISKHRGDAKGSQFALAAVDGACVVLEPNGLCGVHRILGFDRKPGGCAAYPLRDVLAGDELAVGMACECRCTIELSSGDELVAAGESMRRRRAAGRLVEAVADQVPLFSDLGEGDVTLVPLARYLAWRAEAGERLTPDADVVAWALDEATRVEGFDMDEPHERGPSAPEFLSRSLSLTTDIADYLAFEARNTAEVYSSSDLQVKLYAWAARAGARLSAAAAEARPPGPPAIGEWLVAAQSLHTHDLLRAADLRAGLLGLAVRLLLARAGDADHPPELLPVTAAQYLGRSSYLGRLLEDRADSLCAALIDAD